MYVIYLKSGYAWDVINAYGYYKGKTYQVQGELFPYTTNDIKDAKIYKSENMAKKYWKD